MTAGHYSNDQQSLRSRGLNSGTLATGRPVVSDPNQAERLPASFVTPSILSPYPTASIYEIYGRETDIWLSAGPSAWPKPISTSHFQQTEFQQTLSRCEDRFLGASWLPAQQTLRFLRSCVLPLAQLWQHPPNFGIEEPD
jgi:hypothetical protein